MQASILLLTWIYCEACSISDIADVVSKGGIKLVAARIIEQAVKVNLTMVVCEGSVAGITLELRISDITGTN